MTPARDRLVALALCVVGAAVLLLAASQVWFRGRAGVEGLPALPVRLTGRDVASVVSAVGLLALAAAAVMLLVGGPARRVAGVVVALGAVVAVREVLDAAALDRDATVIGSLDTAVPGATTSLVTTTTPWPWVALLGSVLVLAGGVLAAWRGARWPSRTSRYDAAPASAAPTPALEDLPADERSDAMWKALDRGEDPTAVDPPVSDPPNAPDPA